MSMKTIAPKILAAPNQHSLAICLVGSQQTYFQLRAAFLSLARSSAKGYYATVYIVCWINLWHYVTLFESNLENLSFEKFEWLSLSCKIFKTYFLEVHFYFIAWLKGHVADCCFCLVCRTYAEGIQKRLMASGIATEMNIIMDTDVLMAIEDATRHQILFAVVVTEQNEIHRSITVNILHGMAQGMLI